MITVISIFIIFFAVVTIASDASGGVFYYFGNKLARYLGLQDTPKPSTQVSDVAKVVELAEGRIRVEYQGTTWFARSNAAAVKISVGDSVKVINREGLTLLIEKVPE